MSYVLVYRGSRKFFYKDQYIMANSGVDMFFTGESPDQPKSWDADISLAILLDLKIANLIAARYVGVYPVHISFFKGE
jgi:hypothetical protein